MGRGIDQIGPLLRGLAPVEARTGLVSEERGRSRTLGEGSRMTEVRQVDPQDAGGQYSDSELDLDLRWWAAANYLTVAQIYLQDNTLLREPLRPEHIKPRLLGHWGTSPGLSMIYALLNRLIRRTDTDCLYVTGPGHGGPALVAATYLEGTYSEVYPGVSRDAAGIHRLCRQFSTPGGIP